VKVSGSNLLRVLNCAPSAWLPQPNRLIAAAVRGTHGHAYCQGRRDGLEHDAAMKARGIPEKYDAMMRSLPESLWNTGGTSEVAFAYNWREDTARVLGGDLQRQYDKAGLKRSSELPGTIDVAAVHKEARMGAVEDLKFITEQSRWRYPPPLRNPQMLFAALCMLLSVPELSAVEMKLVLVVMSDEDEYERTLILTGEVTLMDLAPFREALQATMADVWNKRGEYMEGPWCDECPAYCSCEHQVGLLRATLDTPPATGMFVVTPEQVAQALPRLLAAEKALEVAINAAKKLSDQEPIPLGGDRFYGPVPEDKRTVKAELAERYFAEKYPELLPAVQTEKKVTQESLKEVFSTLPQPARDRVGGGSKTSWVKNFMVELDAAGLVSVKTIHKHRQYTDKERAALLAAPPAEPPAANEEG